MLGRIRLDARRLLNAWQYLHQTPFLHAIVICPTVLTEARFPLKLALCRKALIGAIAAKAKNVRTLVTSSAIWRLFNCFEWRT